MKWIGSLIFAVFLGLGMASSQASTLAEFQFNSPEQERDFRELIEELRCLVCQNESLAGSQAELAQDLRREVYELLMQGKNKEQVISFLVTRYGDFVLYNPPLKPSTYPLWFGPFILIAVGGFFLARTLLRKRQSRESELSAEEQERLNALLAEKSEPKEEK